jgi:hypothetical protein
MRLRKITIAAPVTLVGAALAFGLLTAPSAAAAPVPAAPAPVAAKAPATIHVTAAQLATGTVTLAPGQAAVITGTPAAAPAAVASVPSGCVTTKYGFMDLFNSYGIMTYDNAVYYEVDWLFSSSGASHSIQRAFVVNQAPDWTLTLGTNRWKNNSTSVGGPVGNMAYGYDGRKDWQPATRTYYSNTTDPRWTINVYKAGDSAAGQNQRGTRACSSTNTP